MEPPAFFSLDAITLGPQAGGAVGPLAMPLMSGEAIRSFTQDDNFAIDASARAFDLQVRRRG